MEGGWHLLKWPFFNGEGTWLHKPDHHRLPPTRDFLRQAFAILNRYEDAFASSDVEPLVPTRRPTLYANRFSGKRHTVWTFFNADYTTARGELPRLPASQGAASTMPSPASRSAPAARGTGSWCHSPSARATSAAW